jgi:ADP-ribose pyrophosphatase YjhB (NUDIX family)
MKFEFAVVDCLVEKDGKFLIVQESKPGREGLYNLPGGHIDNDETLAEAAVRETAEETGYSVELTGFIGIYQSVFSSKQLNISGPAFLAKVVGGEARSTQEHPEVRWVTTDEFLELYAAGKFWTSYPERLMQDYVRRGAYPLEAVVSQKY